MLTVFCGVVPFEPVQPTKVYPFFAGCGNVNVAVSTSYVVFCPLIDPPLSV